MPNSSLLLRPYKSRVRRPKDKSGLLDRLTQRRDGGIFESFKDVLVFAASYGFSSGKRVEFDVTDEAINWITFEEYEPLINLLSVAATGDALVLDIARFGERLLIFEEFANGGLELMEGDLTLARGDQGQACYLAMLNIQNRTSTQPPAHGSVVADILADLLQ